MINSFNSSNNLTSPKKIEEDQKNDKSLRPSSFNDFVGQTDIIDNLKIYIKINSQLKNNTVSYSH